MRVTVAILGMAVSILPTLAENQGQKSKSLKLAMTCFQTGEQISGMNKICYYDCLGSQAAITISSVQLCPLTIQR
jgi:hypothetical protein